MSSLQQLRQELAEARLRVSNVETTTETLTSDGSSVTSTLEAIQLQLDDFETRIAALESAP